jgi:transcription elongation factor Elf1
MDDEATFNCPHCGALYAVIVGHRLAALDGRANCQVCKREMIRWSTTSPPTFRLVEKPEDRSEPKV